MKLNKLFIGLSVLATLAFTACSDDDDYSRATIEGQQVYFANEIGQTINVSKEASSVTVSLCRVATDGDLTVNLTTECDNSVWNVPSSVTFQDGDTVTPIVITYDPEAIEYAAFDSIRISIADASYTTPYGLSYFEGVIGAPEPWSDPEPYNSAGTCTYSYDQFDPGSTDAGLTFLVSTNSVTGMQRFTISNWCYDVTLTLDYNPETGEVSVEPQAIGYYHEDYESDIYITDYKHFYVLRDWGETDAVGSFDTEQGIITIPVVYYLAEGPSQYGYFYAGEETIYLDGFNRLKADIAVTYAGRFFDTKSNPYICGNITLGADVTSANVALVPESEMGEDTWATTRAAILDGTYANLQTISASGEVRFDASELADGTYYIVAISFVDNEAQNLDYAKVNYTASSDKETFTDLFKGTYTYTLYFGSTDEPYADEGLILSQSDKDENKYKIGSWGYGVDFVFSFQEDGSILVAECETGYEHPNYGMVMVEDLVSYTGKTDYGVSSYDSSTGTFTFAVVYYVEGTNPFAYGNETFQITEQAVKARIDAAQRKAMSSKKALKVSKKAAKHSIARMGNDMPRAISLGK